MRESTAGTDALPLEVAWQASSAHIPKVDERTVTLLRAAFEAGYEAASAEGH